MVVTQKAAEVAALLLVSRLLRTRTTEGAPSPVRGRAMPARPPDARPRTASQELPPLPAFISEVADGTAHYHRAHLPGDKYLFVGFYGDGRVRMATPQGRRFSGIMVEQRAVMADLNEDVSFEVGVAVHAHADDLLMLEMDGGPYDGQTLQCETLR